MSEFHEGEIAVQAQAGVRKEAESLSHVINPLIQPKAQEFLRERRLAISSTIDARGSCWASLLTGKSGFIEVVGETEVAISPYVVTVDLLYKNLAQKSSSGIINN